MVAKPLYPLYKNIIKPLDRVRYPELRYYMGEGDKIHEAICVNLFFMNNPAGTKGTLGTPYNFFTHRRAYVRTYIYRVYN